MSDRMATVLNIRKKSGSLRKKEESQGKVKEFERLSQHKSFAIL